VNAAKSKVTGSVLMKYTLPDQTCQTLAPGQFNDVLKQLNLAKDTTEQLCVTRTLENSPDIGGGQEQVRPHKTHIFRQLQAIQPLK